jgi:hypothetical membrane protein
VTISLFKSKERKIIPKKYVPYNLFKWIKYCLLLYCWVGILEKEKSLKIIFIVGVGCSILAFLLFTLAIIFYPGGNIRDANHPGFDFFYNTMSDLGGINAVNGELNIVSRSLYASAILVTGITVTSYYLIAPSFFQKRKATKWLSIIATALGMIQAVLYILMAFTPVDTKPVAHNRLIYSSPAFLYAAIFIYTIVYFLDKDFPKINRYSFLAMSTVSILLTITVILGSILGDPLFTLSRRAGHTVFNFIVVILYGLQPLGGYFYVKNGIKIDEEIEERATIVS